MQAVILAAGKGTRMAPLTYDIPKPMLQLRGKPILEYTLNTLPKEVDEIIIVINYLGQHIQEYFGQEFQGKKIIYVTQEKLDGTGGAILACKNVLKENFLILMGDDLYHPKDIQKLSEENLAILACEVENPTRFGVFKTDEKNRLLEIIEKPKSSEYKLVNAGAYVLTDKFFDYDLVAISETEFGLPQTIAKMAKDFDVKIIPTTAWQPVGYPEDLEKAEKILDKFLK
jgi:bifunctional UDP-N-acetylglucosamine pyrophosphorylase/glucosamine-1-phosphate N-acetyltransferase